MAENTNIFKSIFTKALFILGIIIIVVILAFAVIKIIPKVFSGFASVAKIIKSPFVDKSISIEASDDALKSGDTTVLAWEYNPTTKGSYVLSYACVSNVQISMATTNGAQRLICNTPYTFPDNIQAVEITPTITRENLEIDIPFSIEFITSEDESVADGSADINVSNKKGDSLASSGTIVSTPIITGAADDKDNDVKPTSTSRPSTGVVAPAYNYPRIADLAISNMVDNSSGLISFTVSNIGSAATGNWLFNYTTPDGETSYSPLQASLNPGDAIRYTLRFNDLTDGTMSINVDPQNSVYESNNANNSIAMRVGGNDGNYNGSIDYDEDDDADLDIDSYEVGRMVGNSFREDDNIEDNDDAAVRFTVINKGGENTGSWRFEISNTPDDGDTYRSKTQSSMRPGESRTITVEFNNPDTGIFNMKLTLDSDDDVDEESEKNNTDTEELEIED